MCQHFGLPRFTSTLSTAPQRSFFRFNHFITFLFPKISPIRLASQKYPLGNKANNPCFFFSICSKCQPYYFFNKRKENHKWFFAIYESLLPNIFGYQCIKDDITYFGSDSSFAQIGTALIAISAKIENIS